MTAPNPTLQKPVIIDALADISANYSAVLCDLWGCLHDGLRPFDAAMQTLQALRQADKYVLLLTNSPRPCGDVIAQLDAIGVGRELYHDVVSSGDSARAAVAKGDYGAKIHHLGPARDLPFFHTPNGELLDGITLTTQTEADSIVCTGLINDETETPDDYRKTLQNAVAQNLPMLCANPDIIVDRGTRRIFCAGALAQMYAELGGRVAYCGKPHAPIYTLARERLTEHAGRNIADSQILCIGDGIHTDIAGAVAQNLDCVFISGGLAAKQTATARQTPIPASRPNPQKLAQYLNEHNTQPTYTLGHLR